MIYEIFAFYDTKAGIYSQPFAAHNVAVATRMASEQAADMSSLIGRHPADFSLFRLAVFDDQTGQYSGNPEHVCSLLSLAPRPDVQRPGSLFEGARPNGELRSPL